MARRRSTRDAVVQDVVTMALRQRRNRGVWIAVALLVVVGSAVWSHFRNPADPSKWDGQSVIVRRVVDGDTIVVDGPGMENEHVRLRGVDAPEVAHGGQPDMHFGPQAKQYLAGRLTGKPITLKFDGTEKRDRYQRLLGYVYLDETDCVNVALVRDGMAYVDRRFKTMLQSQLEQSETQARNKGVGLWKDVTTEQQPPWRQKWLEKTLSRPKQ
ncbi:MAG TPA: thermonuclease family protein [Tepidisphaeraceae bacterium]|jgi:endonuclease YncB( thermonuclease family)